nr:hypothetical protein [Tanacetum cinerariifolium]
MSDSEESGVTYTGISDPYVEVALQVPPSPDYVPGPEHADDEIVAEDQPYAEDASPITQSPEYVPESDFEAHPEDDDDEDPEEDLVDYPADGGDDGDDEEESSEDDDDEDDDEMDTEGDDEEEEEEHPAPADSDRPEVTLPPRKRLDIALVPRYEVGESSSAAAARPAGGFRADYGFVAAVNREIMRDPEREVGYGITDSWDEIVETLQGAPDSTDTELGGYVREFESRVRQDMDEIYTRLDDEQTARQLLAGQLNMLFRDRRAHAYTRLLMEAEARMSREAWTRATDASDLVHGEVISLRTTVLGQISEIRELQAADRRRQTVISELLRLKHRRSTETSKSRTALQGQITALQGQEMIDQGVTAALAARDALRSTNGDDSHNSGTGVRRTEQAARECTYTEFLKCQPLPFKRTKGVASLSQWCERMESVFHISNCTAE